MKTLLISLRLFLVFTILTGIIYPLIITLYAQIAFPSKANGSMVYNNSKIAGSELIGQRFDSLIYFTSRPAANNYNPLPSGGTNYGLTNKKLKETVYCRKRIFIINNILDSMTPIPSEMLFASASGLDPHISPESALLQIDRICKIRNFDKMKKEKLILLIKDLTEMPQFLCLGEERINVLHLNIELNKL